MELFSDRMGITSPRNKVQLNSVDILLRNKLWNAIETFYWEGFVGSLSDRPRLHNLMKILWHEYFKLPLDTLEPWWADCRKELREKFFRCSWYEVYNFIEFLPRSYEVYTGENTNSGFRKFCNGVLQEEVSAYRFVGETIVRITNKEEIDEVEAALSRGGALRPIQTHLSSALDKLSDRTNPDYRNSIKESISAVETLASLTFPRSLVQSEC